MYKGEGGGSTNPFLGFGKLIILKLQDFQCVGPGLLFKVGPGSVFKVGPDSVFNVGPGSVFKVGPGSVFKVGPGSVFNVGPGSMFNEENKCSTYLGLILELERSSPSKLSAGLGIIALRSLKEGFRTDGVLGDQMEFLGGQTWFREKNVDFVKGFQLKFSCYLSLPYAFGDSRSSLGFQ